jgi:hypothetical protein
MAVNSILRSNHEKSNVPLASDAFALRPMAGGCPFGRKITTFAGKASDYTPDLEFAWQPFSERGHGSCSRYLDHGGLSITSGARATGHGEAEATFLRPDLLDLVQGSCRLTLGLLDARLADAKRVGAMFSASSLPFSVAPVRPAVLVVRVAIVPLAEGCLQ